MFSEFHDSLILLWHLSPTTYTLNFTNLLSLNLAQAVNVLSFACYDFKSHVSGDEEL